MKKKGYLHDLDTIASYYPFSLYLSAPLSIVTSRTLVVIWCAADAGVQTFQKTWKQAQIFADVKWLLTYSRYPPSARIQAGLLVCIVALLADGLLSEVIK
jgi:hypothetical protein